MLRIYKSSAGSGKTYTLVKEYLRMAFDSPTKYKHILAITFTNKAAAEMKDRILSALEGIANQYPDFDTLTQELCIQKKRSEEQLRKDAAAILRDMLHNYSDISVSTIDSFVHRIVRSFAYDLHLPMNFEIEMDSNKLLTDAVELLLDRLNESDQQVTQAVLDFALSKIEEGKSWNVDRDMASLGKELFSDEALPHIRKLGGVEFDKLKEVRAALHAQKKSFESKLLAEGAKAFRHIMSNGLTAKDFHQGTKGVYGFFDKYASGGIPKDPKGNSYVRAAMLEDNWGKKPLDEPVKQELGKLYQGIVALLDNEGKDYYLAELLLQNFYSFILLADLQKLLDELKKENNVLHISDFQQKVFEIVKEQEAPIIYERIGEKYDNILIDEFQDTSVIQWRNLLPLIENSQFKSQDSLIVGDGKQAIYRFRGGEVGQFAALPKVYGSDSDYLLKEREVAIGNYGTEVHTLEKNYRSRKEVIDFNNSLYKHLLELPDLKNKSIYEDYFQEQGRKTSEAGFVSIEFLKDDKEDELSIHDYRCQRVEEIVNDVLTRGYSYKDIAVLTRSNSNASIIAAYLVEHGIKVVSPESLLIDHSPKVRLLLSVFRYLDKKDDHIARAEILHYVHLLSKKDVHYESLDLKTPFAEFEKMLEALTAVPFNSGEFFTGRLSDLTQQLIHLFNLNDDDPFLQFFADEILLYTSRYGNGMGDFLHWWSGVKHKKSIIYPDSMDAVRIMTIHKSKGLQFPVVILADACDKMKLNKDFFWVDLKKKWLPQLNVGILPVKKDVKETEFASLYETEEEHSFLDLLNLLYVGTTRPEDALYILSAQMDKEPEENNSVTALLLSYLKRTDNWDGFKAYFFGEVDYQKEQKRKKEEMAVYEKGKTISRNILSSSIKVRMKADLLWSEETTGKIDEGKLLHEALKQVKYEGDEEIVLKRMLAQGVLSAEAVDKLRRKLKKVIGNKELNRYFAREMIVVNERALLKENEKNHIPDRVVIQNGAATIIDYKTGKENIAHRQQLTDYAKLLEEAGIKVKQKILFYTGSEKAEVVK
jgi:ATP-dependent exoDNAse (exonuclease V) beta subunit